MSDGALPPGKLPTELLSELLAAAPSEADELLVPPRIGEDACVIAVPGGALVAASDPITLTGAAIGGYAVVINANDVAVTGARPRWFLATLLLPIGTREADVRTIFAEMGRELDRLGAVLVGGHSEVTAAVRQPVVVGQMLGLREDGGFVRTGGAQPGDVVLQVGAAPIEGAAVLAQEAGEALSGVAQSWLERARDALRDPGISVVAPALLCSELGAHALHDPTEGGLSAGLHEIATASGVALRGLDPERMLWFEPGRVLCEALGADPWGTLASGSLLAVFAPVDAERAAVSLSRAGHDVRSIADAESGEGVWLQGGQPLPRYERDELSRVL